MLIYELKKRNKVNIIFAIGMILLIIISMVKGNAIIGTESIGAMMEVIPPIIAAMFGLSSIDITTPFGYLSVLYTYIAMALAIYGIVTSVGIFSNDYSDKTIEYILAKPISRKKIAVVKITSALLMVTIMNFVTYITCLICFSAYINVQPELFFQVTLLCFSIYILALLMIAISYIIMSIIGISSKAISISLVILITFYFLNILAIMFPQYKFLYYITPFQFLGPLPIYNDAISLMLFIILIIVIVAVFLTVGYRIIKKNLYLHN